MMSEVLVNIDRNAISNLTSVAITALEQTADALLTEIQNAEIVPFDEGALHSSAFVDRSESASGKVDIVYSTPYARRLYFHPEYNFQTYEHAFAQGKWFEPWVIGPYKDFAKNAFKKIYRRLL